jgi:hypothetical protein
MFAIDAKHVPLQALQTFKSFGAIICGTDSTELLKCSGFPPRNWATKAIDC